MKRTSKTILIAAAVSGLISGAAMQSLHGEQTNAVAGKVAPVKKAPKVHDCSGQNDCKGIGGCKTETHECKFKNSCKGKGGCELKESDIKLWQKKQKEEAAKAAAKHSVNSTTNAPAAK